MLDFQKFSKKYNVRRLKESDIGLILKLCEKNTLFYEYCPPFATEKTILDDMNALPDGKGKADKYYIGFFSGSSLTAVMDLIDAYPNEQTAFIGFFMTDRSVQRKGVGTEIIKELSEYLKADGYKHIRLCWVKGNYQSESFWHKNLFFETGICTATDDYTMIVAQREL